MPKQERSQLENSSVACKDHTEEVHKKLDIHGGDAVVWVIDDEGCCILKKVKIEV